MDTDLIYIKVFEYQLSLRVLMYISGIQLLLSFCERHDQISSHTVITHT